MRWYNYAMDIKYEWMLLGPCPFEEDCASMEDYSAMTQEVRRYCQMLNSIFINRPDNCEFRVKSEHHDFGTYKEAAIYYEMDNEEALNFALFVERNLPARWNNTKQLNWKKVAPADWITIDTSV